MVKPISKVEFLSAVRTMASHALISALGPGSIGGDNVSRYEAFDPELARLIRARNAAADAITLYAKKKLEK